MLQHLVLKVVVNIVQFSFLYCQCYTFIATHITAQYQTSLSTYWNIYGISYIRWLQFAANFIVTIVARIGMQLYLLRRHVHSSPPSTSSECYPKHAMWACVRELIYSCFIMSLCMTNNENKSYYNHSYGISCTAEFPSSLQQYLVSL